MKRKHNVLTPAQSETEMEEGLKKFESLDLEDMSSGSSCGESPGASYDGLTNSVLQANRECLFTFDPDESLGRDDINPESRVRASTITTGLDIDERRLPTVFKWEGGGKNVYISGSFDNWKSKIPLVKSQGDFYTIIELPEGKHQYKFMVDGQWQCDPNEAKADNDVGTQNNVVTVRSSDFEVFEALAMDSISAGASKSGSGSPPGEYSQSIPTRNSGQGLHHSGPPILPPHLLQVILNKEVPLHCEPTLLPEPNHVMLNHLYALSIKDGVMVLSATHRYRKKYVTTLLYKPI